MASDDYRLEAGLAWTAYIGPLVTLVAWLLVGTAALRVAGSAWAHGLGAEGTPASQSPRFWLIALGVLLVLAGLLLFAWRVAAIRSVRLYTDEAGIWRRRGVFPWTRNVYGVRWRDLEIATFTGSLGSWLMRSYAIRVGHRYTRTSELAMEHVANGKSVVEAINAMHTRWLAAFGNAKER